MRPVDERFPISQLFAGLATRGVVGRPDGSEVEYLVWLYGDYQPYGHAGVDIACPVGTPVRAMRAGTVVYAGWGEDLPGDDSWGPSGYFRRWGMYKNFPGIVPVIKADGVNEYDIYGHQFSNDAVHVGLHVQEAQVIGLSGDTKTRREKVGPHLHVVTVADPVNYSTDWPRIIFGCVDPTPLFDTTGLVLSGAVNNAATQYQEEPLVPNESDKVFWPIEGSEKVSLNELLNSIDRKATAALSAITGLLSVQLPDPTDPGKTYSVADFIVWSATNAKISAGAAGVAASNTDPTALARAVTEGAASVDAQAIADKLTVTVKEG